MNWGLVFFHNAFVCVSARHLESVATPGSNSKDLGGSELNLWSACEDTSLFGGSTPSESQPKLRRISQALWLGGPWTPVSVPWSLDGVTELLSHTPESEDTRRGEWPPCAWLTFPDLHSRRIWLGRSLLSGWFCDSFKKMFFMFFQLCSEGGLIWITQTTIPRISVPPIDVFFPLFILNLSVSVSVDFVGFIFLFTESKFLSTLTDPFHLFILTVIYDVFRDSSIVFPYALFLPCFFWDFHFFGPFIVHHTCEFIPYTVNNSFLIQ